MTRSDESHETIDRLASQMLDLGLSQDHRAQLLNDILQEPTSCDRFIEYMLLHAALRKELGGYRPATLSESLFGATAGQSRYELNPPSCEGNASSPLHSAGAAPAQVFWRGWFRRRGPIYGSVWFIGGMLAAMIAMAFIAPRMFTFDPEENAAPSPRTAIVASSIDALWSGRTHPDGEGWLPAGELRLSRGQVEIRFLSGAMVVLKAPAEFEAVSATEARLSHGSLAARVDGSITTFRIHTPTSEVVDLGTEFGLSVSRSGETDIAVFDGLVHVMAATNRTAGGQRRLATGEALRVDEKGQFQRLATIRDDVFPVLPRQVVTQEQPRPSLITAVRDNLRDEDLSKFYRIVPRGFGEDVRAYVDRTFEWNGIDASGMPEFLIGADYIMMFNDDKKNEELEITVTLAQPAIVYVLIDNRTPVPSWLAESFVDTGLEIGMDEDGMSYPTVKPRTMYRTLGKGPGVNVDQPFSIWMREVPEAGKVVFGPQLGMSDQSMYGIVAAPLQTRPLLEDR